MGSTTLARVLWLALLVLSTVTLTGCEAIADIFKAGVWVGVVGVLIVIGVIAFVIAKVSS